MENVRTSTRLARDPAVLSDDDSDDDDYANESSRAPVGNQVWDSEDKKWKSFAVNKFVYFRWSTAHNSKNRFKGVVLDHRSRVPRSGYTVTSTLIDSSKRVDYLDIKTFGISEDTYVMGKDIREMYVLPNKTVLMSAATEDDIRKHAIRKWTSKQGWIEGNDLVGSSNSTAASTSVNTPKISSVSKLPDDSSVSTAATSASAPIAKKRKPLIGPSGSKKRTSNGTETPSFAFPPITPFGNLKIPESNAAGIHGSARHTKRSFAYRIKFAFSDGIY